MRADELTDEDIGREFYVLSTLAPAHLRITFEGVLRKPEDKAAENLQGGSPYWLILLCTPTAGAMQFRTQGDKLLTGVLVRSGTEVTPVNVIYGVDPEGNIVEIDRKAA